MTPRNLINIGLALAVVALGVLVWRAGSEPAVPAQTPLTPLAPEQITTLGIEADGRPAIALRRDGADWRLADHPTWRVNPARVRGVLALAGAASHVRFSLADKDPAQYGLDAPRLTLVLDDTRIAFGASEPLKQRRYVRVGDTVHLIDDTYSFRAGTAATDWVDTALLPPNSSPVRIATSVFTLEQHDGHWTREPAEAATSADTYNQFVDEWRSAQALKVQPYLPHPGAAQLRVLLSGQTEPITFESYDTGEGKVFARPDLGLQYLLSDSSAERLLSPAAHLPDAPQP